jgi:hypothetical protein
MEETKVAMVSHRVATKQGALPKGKSWMEKKDTQGWDGQKHVPTEVKNDTAVLWRPNHSWNPSLLPQH